MERPFSERNHGLEKAIRTRPTLANACSSSRVSTCLLRPETCKLFPGLLASVRLCVLQYMSVMIMEWHNVPSFSGRAAAPARTSGCVTAWSSSRRASAVRPVLFLRSPMTSIAYARILNRDANSSTAVGGPHILRLPC